MTLYVLAPDAAADLVEIFRHVRKEAGEGVANRVETSIREEIAFLRRIPALGTTVVICAVSQ